MKLHCVLFGCPSVVTERVIVLCMYAAHTCSFNYKSDYSYCCCLRELWVGPKFWWPCNIIRAALSFVSTIKYINITSYQNVICKILTTDHHIEIYYTESYKNVIIHVLQCIKFLQSWNGHMILIGIRNIHVLIWHLKYVFIRSDIWFNTIFICIIYDSLGPNSQKRINHNYTGLDWTGIGQIWHMISII